MFSPFSSFPVPQDRRGPHRDHLMDWLGWRGAEFMPPPDDAAPETVKPPDKPTPMRGRH